MTAPSERIFVSSEIADLTTQQRVIVDELAREAPYVDVQPAVGSRAVWVWCWSAAPEDATPQRLLAVHRVEPNGRGRQLVRSR
jgi:hypothetical protein